MNLTDYRLYGHPLKTDYLSSLQSMEGSLLNKQSVLKLEYRC